MTRRTGHTSTGPKRASCFSSGPGRPDREDHAVLEGQVARRGRLRLLRA